MLKQKGFQFLLARFPKTACFVCTTWFQRGVFQNNFTTAPHLMGDIHIVSEISLSLPCFL